jgi:hypothetical protein
MTPPAGLFSWAALARRTRRELEDALGDRVEAWPWSARCSNLLDLLVLIEERAA